MVYQRRALRTIEGPGVGHESKAGGRGSDDALQGRPPGVGYATGLRFLLRRTVPFKNESMEQ